MKTSLLSLTAALLSLAACDVQTVRETDSAPTKDEVREQVQKGDILIDWCDELGWYGDEICDPFCAEPDPDCEVEGECRATGCSGDVCADQDVITTCEVRPEAECLKLAMCERQVEGECGFTPTAASEECFAALFGDDDDDDDDAKADDGAWLELSPTQCGTNPWEGGALNVPNEIDRIVEHYDGLGIEIDSIGLLQPNEPIAVCFACQCPRGDRLVVHVDADSVDAAKDAGFSEAGALAHDTVQCGGNPWEALPQPADEAGKLGRWTREQGAFAYTGFVNPIEPMAVCLACSCPRGDVAMAIPGSDDDAATLTAGGFAPAQ